MPLSPQEIERNKQLAELYPEPTVANYSSPAKPKITTNNIPIDTPTLERIGSSAQSIISSSILVPVPFIVGDIGLSIFLSQGKYTNAADIYIGFIGMLVVIGISISLGIAIRAYIKEKVLLSFGAIRTVFGLATFFAVPVIVCIRNGLLWIHQSTFVWWTIGLYITLACAIFTAAVAVAFRLLITPQPRIKYALFLTSLPYLVGVIVAIVKYVMATIK